MTYTARTRDRFKSLVALVTGVAAFASVTAAGAATGSAAHDTALRDQAREQEQARLDAAARVAALQAAGQQATAPPPITVVGRRPQRTVVRTHVVHQVSRPGVAAVGPGGTISALPPSAPVTPPDPAAGPAPAPAPAPLPAPVAAAPAPAPTTGS